MKSRFLRSTRFVFRLLLGMALVLGAGAAWADHRSRDRHYHEPETHHERARDDSYHDPRQGDYDDPHRGHHRAGESYPHEDDRHYEERYHQDRYGNDRYGKERYREGHRDGDRYDDHRDGERYDHERASPRHLRQLEERRRQFDALPQQQQQRLRDTRDRFYQLPPEQRLRLREKWRELPREERRRWRHDEGR